MNHRSRRLVEPARRGGRWPLRGAAAAWASLATAASRTASAARRHGEPARSPSSMRDSVLTSVRESSQDAATALTTAIAIGMNRKRAGPTRSTTGKNTMQIASVATISGVEICAAASRMATVSGLPSDGCGGRFRR